MRAHASRKGAVAVNKILSATKGNVTRWFEGELDPAENSPGYQAGTFQGEPAGVTGRLSAAGTL
ncbi:MAG: hypothetical protein EOO38_18755 [Cytophagaceae bacterium]|nr:MAG: hypothetical protein EOO38_18755 [Cytophagaceae bacterium]